MKLRSIVVTVILSVIVTQNYMMTKVEASAKIPAHRTMAGVYQDRHTIITKDGNIWKVSGKLSRKAGRVVKVTFNTKGTSRVEDDIITGVK